MKTFVHRRLFVRLQSATAVIVACCALPAISAGAPRFPSHCTNTEKILFSCKLRGSAKYISLCGTNLLNAPDAYLVYRFGRLGKKEFSYPADSDGSLQRFRTTHYFRAQVDRRTVSFTNSNVTYDIFRNFEGEELLSHRDAGVTITVVGEEKPSKILQCRSPYFDALEKLDGVVLKGPGYLGDDE